jgi:hypothetical protein
MSDLSVPPQRIWDRRTLGSCALSILLATGVTLSVCAAKGDLSTSVQPPAKSSVQSPTETCGV